MKSNFLIFRILLRGAMAKKQAEGSSLFCNYILYYLDKKSSCIIVNNL